MAINTKEVKQRLSSIRNTQKITKAMELVAASKMRKTVASATASRTYATLAWEIVQRLITRTDITKTSRIARYIQPCDKNPHTTYIIFSSNRGLCGAFNSHIVQKVLSLSPSSDNDSFISIGKKGAAMLASAGIHAHLVFDKSDIAQNDRAIMNVSDLVMEKFTNGKTDRVMIIYTDYQSPVLQTTVARQLLPFSINENISFNTNNTPLPSSTTEYLYEPSQEIILETLLPRVTHLQLYQALLESNASEHSARMLAMKNATDAAHEMADDLTLLFNRARQAAITKEIAEISAAMAALT